MQELHERYQKETLVGHGNMSKVYSGIDVKLQRKVIIKESFEEVILREVKAMTHLSGRYTSFLVDYCLSQGQSQLIMLPVDGVPLDYYIKRHRSVPLNVLKGAIIDWCNGLKELHQTHIHCDIAPDQLWMTNQQSGVLLDFGSAILKCQKQIDEICAHQETIAPEIERGFLPSEKSDVYSLCKSVLQAINLDDIYYKSLVNILLMGISIHVESRPSLDVLIQQIRNL